MNFTREPIIETVISPREGCKLVLRNSKSSGGEDYFVDAVEVVSFGSSIFYRSTERPKSFLLPVTDYEILELKETRMVLKNVGTDRSIKIGGGKDKDSSSSDNKEPSKKRRTRRRKSAPTEAKEPAEKVPEPSAEKPSAKGGDKVDEASVSSPGFAKLIPPPATLIKEKLARHSDEEILEANLLEKEVEKSAPNNDQKEEVTPPAEPKVDEIVPDEPAKTSEEIEEELKERSESLKDEPEEVKTEKEKGE